MSNVNPAHFPYEEIRRRGWYHLSQVSANSDFIGITTDGICVRCRKVSETIEVMGGILTEHYYVMEEHYRHCVLAAAKNPGYGFATWFRNKLSDVALLIRTSVFMKALKDAK